MSLSWRRVGPWQAIKVWRLRVVAQIDLLSHQPEGSFLDVTMLLRRLPCSDPANEPRSSAQPGYSHLLTGARQDYLPERTRPAWCHALLECLEVAVARFDGPQVWARPEVNTLVKLAAERRQNFTRPQQEVLRRPQDGTSPLASIRRATRPRALSDSPACDPPGLVPRRCSTIGRASARRTRQQNNWSMPSICRISPCYSLVCVLCRYWDTPPSCTRPTQPPCCVRFPSTLRPSSSPFNDTPRSCLAPADLDALAPTATVAAPPASAAALVPSAPPRPAHGALAARRASATTALADARRASVAAWSTSLAPRPMRTPTAHPLARGYFWPREHDSAQVPVQRSRCPCFCAPRCACDSSCPKSPSMLPSSGVLAMAAAALAVGVVIGMTLAKMK